MKNLKGILGYGVAEVMSILTLAWSAMAFQSAKSPLGNELISIFDVLSETLDGKAQTSKIMAIIALVLACILTVTCIFGLLDQLGILKIKFIAYVNYAVAGLFVLFALLALIFCAMYCSDMNKLLSLAKSSLSVGAGLIMYLVSSIAALAGVLVATINPKKKAA